jgi:hypothetical protein
MKLGIATKPGNMAAAGVTDTIGMLAVTRVKDMDEHMPAEATVTRADSAVEIASTADTDSVAMVDFMVADIGKPAVPPSQTAGSTCCRPFRFLLEAPCEWSPCCTTF